MEHTERARRVQAEAARLRTEAGWGWREWARQAQVSRTQLWEIARGDARPRQPAMLARLARAAGRPWDYFGAAVPPEVPAGAARRLATARLAQGLGVRDLAARSGVDPHTILHAEAGRPTQATTWAKLAAALGLPPDAL